MVDVGWNGLWVMCYGMMDGEWKVVMGLIIDDVMWEEGYVRDLTRRGPLARRILKAQAV